MSELQYSIIATIFFFIAFLITKPWREDDMVKQIVATVFLFALSVLWIVALPVGLFVFTIYSLLKLAKHLDKKVH